MCCTELKKQKNVFTFEQEVSGFLYPRISSQQRSHRERRWIEEDGRQRNFLIKRLDKPGSQWRIRATKGDDGYAKHPKQAPGLVLTAAFFSNIFTFSAQMEIRIWHRGGKQAQLEKNTADWALVSSDYRFYISATRKERAASAERSRLCRSPEQKLRDPALQFIH